MAARLGEGGQLGHRLAATDQRPLDAARLGFDTRVRLDLTAGVAASSVELALAALRETGVELLGTPIVRA